VATDFARTTRKNVNGCNKGTVFDDFMAYHHHHLKIIIMRAKKIFAPPAMSDDRIKLRIDHKTIITVKSKQALQMWMGKYPGATIID
jgi:hypothetical protein